MTPQYVVIWNGRGAMPHQEADAEYWRTKRSIMDYAPGKRDYIAPKDFHGKGGVQPANTSWRMAVISAPKAKRPSPKEAREARLERHRQKRTAA